MRGMKTELIDVLKKIRKLNTDQDSYLDSVPRDLRCSVFDNKFAELEGLKYDMLMQTLFGDLYEDVCWFLYEFNPNNLSINSPHIVDNDKEYTFKSDDDVYEYFKTL
jgi:hypothetical protein